MSDETLRLALQAVYEEQVTMRNRIAELEAKLAFAREWISGLPTDGHAGREDDKRAALKALQP